MDKALRMECILTFISWEYSQRTHKLLEKWHITENDHTDISVRMHVYEFPIALALDTRLVIDE